MGHFSDSSSNEHKYFKNAEMFGVFKTIIGRLVISKKWFYYSEVHFKKYV